MGELLRRALDLKSAMALGVHVTLDDLRADELWAIEVIEQERRKWDAEQN